MVVSYFNHLDDMFLIPVSTERLVADAPLSEIIRRVMKIEHGDILVISSKAIATVEGAVMDLAKEVPSDAARELSRATGRSPEFHEAMLKELARLRGKVVNVCPGAALTEVRPYGLPRGSILTANAGLDESNVLPHHAIGWPRDPVKSVAKLRRELGCAVIVTDSCCMPRRQGVTAFALAVSGLDPLVSQKGKKDLFGKELKITTEAIADQLATAANFLMGNADQAIPAVLIRDHGLASSDYEGWVPGIEPEEDLFKGIV